MVQYNLLVPKFGGSPRDVNAAIASAGFRWARKSPLAGNATNLTGCVRIR